MKQDEVKNDEWRVEYDAPAISALPFKLLKGDSIYAAFSERDHAMQVLDYVNRSRRAGGEGAGKVGVKEKFTIGGKNIFRWRRYGGKPWNCEEYANGVWNPAEPTDEVEGEKDATPADLAASGILISDIANPELRAAVEALRRPTLPDGSRMVVSEMYVSDWGELYRIINVGGDRPLIEVFSRGIWKTPTHGYYNYAGQFLDVDGTCYTGNKNHLARLAQPANIPAEIDITIVPERIREQVRQQRGAGALKWEENNQCVVRFVDGKMWRWKVNPNRDAWEESFLEKRYFDRYPVATPSQIIAANVPEQDIPACQIEGVRAERERRASELSGDELIEIGKRACKRMSDLRDEVVAAEKSASPTSPSPESGACQCEAANTLRDLIEAFDGWNDAKTHASLTEGYQSLRRKFELARESLGVESLNAGTEAA